MILRLEAADELRVIQPPKRKASLRETMIPWHDKYRAINKTKQSCNIVYNLVSHLFFNNLGGIFIKVTQGETTDLYDSS